jgi:SAM-dependent methyltransferase
LGSRELSSHQVHFFPESRFGGFTDTDGTILFYSRVNALLQPTFRVLDFGCGRGAYGEDSIPIRRGLRILRGKAARVIGLDIDPAAQENPFVDEFHLLVNQSWPLPGSSVDMCLCDHVLEHLEEPEAFFSETRRVLKGNGFLCMRASNAWGYPALVSRLIPERFHLGVLAKAKDHLKPQDVFPAVYRCNTIPKVRSALSRFGFEGVVYGFRADPSYLAFSQLAYALGILYQRFAPGFLSPVLFVFAHLPGD